MIDNISLNNLLQKLSENRERAQLDAFPPNIDRFNIENRPKEIFSAQLNTLFEPLVIENFLSRAEVALLLSTKDVSEDKGGRSRPGVSLKKYGWNTLEKELLYEKITTAVGACDVASGTYQHILKPYDAHVDLGKDPLFFPYANVLLPLAMSPIETETYLVLFHQRYFGFSSSFHAAPRKKPPFHSYNDNIFEYSNVLGTSKIGISTEDREQLLSHCIPGDLEGLTISHVIPWKIGSLIVFDPTHIHASSNFSTQGIESKIALTLSLGKHVVN
ncbi:MAG: hypothetical protein IT287_00635 [Bdellovibrionaceae bacterium]|nr:hypothetical protein [Pseudobdellovibrionaceae bacterium]